jgi:hypothetical protein
MHPNEMRFGKYYSEQFLIQTRPRDYPVRRERYGVIKWNTIPRQNCYL